MADSEARKLLAQYWAAGGDRADPSDVGLTRSEGWGVSYEQPGSGREPERAVFNQRLLELDEALGDALRFGVQPWDRRINYPGSDATGYAFVVGSDGLLYVAMIPSGPATGNATDPTDANQAVWREY